jgi:hypothetical protein
MVNLKVVELEKLKKLLIKGWIKRGVDVKFKKYWILKVGKK